MATTGSEKDSEEKIEFVRLASETPTGFLKEYWLFLRQNKKWWLTPMLVVLFLVGALVVLGTSSVAPFIYTLF